MSPRSKSLGEFLDWRPVYPDPVIGSGLLYPKGKVLIYGRKDSLKSMLCMDLGMCLVNGHPWATFKVPGGERVLYLQFEISELLMHRRFDKMAEAWKRENGHIRKSRDFLRVWYEPFLKLDNQTGRGVLIDELREIKPTVLIIDPLFKALSGNILDPNSVRALVDSLDSLIDVYDFSIILIHHTRKGSVEDQPVNYDPSDDMLGSAVFSWWADSIVKVNRKGGHGYQETLELTFDKMRHAEETITKREVIFDKRTLLFKPSDETIAT
jgi:RecA-family ATPase